MFAFTFCLIAPTGSPGVPTATSVTSTSIRIYWNEIDCIDRNGVIISYMIQYSSEDNTVRRVVNTQTNATSYNFTDLHPFTSYNITVAGVNSVNMGPRSSSVIRTAAISK